MKKQPFAGISIAIVILAFTNLTPKNSFAEQIFRSFGERIYSSAEGPHAISDDGSTVVGTRKPGIGGEFEAYRWTEESGILGLGFLSLPLGYRVESYAFDVSADGSTVTGFSKSSASHSYVYESFLWTEETGMEMVRTWNGYFYSNAASGISADGSVVVGQHISGQAYIWSKETGMVDLASRLGGPNRSTALAVSADGSTVAGRVHHGNIEAFLWSESDGVRYLGIIDSDPADSSLRPSSVVRDVSADGSVAVGDNYFGAYYIDGSEAFRWTEEGGMVGLGHLPGGTIPHSRANAVSADGSVVVGNSTSSSGREAFIWDNVNGVQSLKNLLENDFGVDLTGWLLTDVTDISADGRSLVGSGTNPQGITVAWIAHLDGAPSSPPPAVVFLPGFAASRLYSDRLLGLDDEVWLPGENDDVCALKPGDFGFYGSEIYTKAEGVLAKAGVKVGNWEGIYSEPYLGFFEKLDELIDDDVISTWKAFPYDWRRDVRNISRFAEGDLESGIIFGSDGVITDHVSLVDEIKALAGEHGPVVLIGHSNGGLLAKAVMQELRRSVGSENVADYVGKVILAASPQLGTPEGLVGALHGEFAKEIPIGSSLAKREAAEKMEGALGLLPSRKYFDKSGLNLIEIDENAESHPIIEAMLETFGPEFAVQSDGDMLKLHEFLTGVQPERVEPEGRDCNTAVADVTFDETQYDPNVFDELAYWNSVGMHADLDNWTPPTGVEVIQIGGYGIPTTATLKYGTKCRAAGFLFLSKYCEIELDTTESDDPTQGGLGDGTVRLESAIAEDAGEQYLNYFINLSEGEDHIEFMRDPAVQDTIETVLKGNSIVANSRVTTKFTGGIPETLRLTMKSPADLLVIDNEGRKTGFDRTEVPDELFALALTEIPGSAIDRVSGHQRVFLQGGRVYQILIDGFEEGKFTLEVLKKYADGEEAVEEFSTLPSNEDMVGASSISEEMEIASLELDYDNDGVVDSTVEPSTGEADLQASLAAIADLVRTLDLDQGIEASLLDKLDDAISLLSFGNDTKAKEKLRALANQLNALSGKKLEADTASYLMLLVGEVAVQL